jgi:hypothetical protein
VPELLGQGAGAQTSDNYSTAATLGPATGVRQLFFQVLDADAVVRYWKVQPGNPNAGPVLELLERTITQGSLVTVPANVAGAEFRSAVPGSPATILGELDFETDVLPAFQQVTQVTLTLSFLQDGVLKGTEQAVDFVDSSSVTWSLTDVPGTKMQVTASVPGSAFPVTSVFGRTGAVVATSGDYTAAQVTNAADKSSGSLQSFTAGLQAPSVSVTGLTGATAGTRYVGATASGSPGSGTFSLGDFVVDQTGAVWVCTVAGSPGTWKNAGASGNLVSSVFGRTGAVVATSGDYTAAQVTNAADKSSASAQIFTANVGSGGGSLSVGAAAGSVIAATGTVASAVGATTGRCFSATVTSDTTDYRWQLLGTGEQRWGSGSVAFDTALNRSGAGILTLTTGTTISLGSITNSSLTNAGTLITSSGGHQQVGAAATVLTAIGVTGNSNYSLTINSAGLHLWGSGSVAGDATLERSAANTLRLTNTGILSSSNTVGVGYATGAGGAVTQATSFNTGVTLSTICGVITLFTSATVAGTVSTFVVTNTKVAATDVVVLSWGTGTNPGALLSVANVASGSFTITWEAVSAQASSTRTINFAIIKSVSS